MLHFSTIAKLLLGTSLTLGLAASAAGQSKDVTPKYSNEFLNIGVGGRALGMGKVQASLANDATAGYWNPAGLVNLKNKYDAVLMHSELFSGIVKNDYAGFAMPLDDKTTIGASIVRVGVDDIANTLELVNSYGYIDYNKITYFSVADYALLLSYARKIGNVEGVSVGVNGKIIYRNVGDFANAYGFGIDAGVQYNHGNWRLGLLARDITTTFNAWQINTEAFKSSANVGVPTPKNGNEITLPRFILGVGRSFQLPGQFTALAAADFDITTDGKRNTLVSSSFASIDPHAGVEVGYNNLVFLRGGVSNIQQIDASISGEKEWTVQPSLGVGVMLSGLRLDLALSRLAVEKLGGTNANSIIVSLGYGFK
jgi:hypothetical protein